MKNRWLKHSSPSGLLQRTDYDDSTQHIKGCLPFTILVMESIISMPKHPYESLKLAQ